MTGRLPRTARRAAVVLALVAVAGAAAGFPGTAPTSRTPTATATLAPLPAPQVSAAAFLHIPGVMGRAARPDGARRG